MQRTDKKWIIIDPATGEVLDDNQDKGYLRERSAIHVGLKNYGKLKNDTINRDNSDTYWDLDLEDDPFDNVRIYPPKLFYWF